MTTALQPGAWRGCTETAAELASPHGLASFVAVAFTQKLICEFTGGVTNVSLFVPTG